MSNADNQEWWMWQMYRSAAEFIREPSNEREARLQFFMASYRYLHNQNNTTLQQPLREVPQQCAG